MRLKTETLKHPGLEQLERMAKLLDSQFRVPGTDLRFGIDPLLGFIPVVGEITTFIMSVYLGITMARYGGSGKLALLMAGNILVDGIVGAIPILGRFFDFYYKANDRNLRLLADHYRNGKHSGSGIGIILVILGAITLVAWLIITVISSLFSYVGGLF